MFEHDGLIWQVPNPQPLSEPFSINDLIATGSFLNNRVGLGDGEEEGGTFTAQASGGADEDANAASAGAH